MPLVRIDLNRSAPPDRARIVGDVVYAAMRAVANVPENDKFQIVTRHEAGEIVAPEAGYLGVTYTDDLVIIQITWNAGRSVEVKRALYRQIADGIAERAGIRREDVFVNLVEVVKENWSFGNGEMQYAPA
ncbi:4-oxalocrotonate tautomerase [Methylobacterium sp. Leaf104]|uniref:tautomerase family protein n=1 Tax=Methylobacterium TaxID=407 RepID=UPI0006FD68BE|nr:MULTISPECIES: tautomerase family protein [Methylobacterium]KQP31665.1 4-oxalocrotonate tautomerase [Methylobacterium sp. Leaf104]MCI9880572.1 tautomerase family protein [Methylobacterium goesingense]